MRTLPTMTLVVVTAALGACGGGGERGPQAPQVSGLTSATLPQDTTSTAIAFRVIDPDTTPDRLTLTVESSNPAVLPVAGIQLGGSGTERTLTLTPAPEATGDATVTVRVRDDAGLTTTATLAVRIDAVLRSFKALTGDAYAASETAQPVSLQGFTVQPDADDDPAAFDGLVQ